MTAKPLAIITGATTGIGYETALGLARAGHDTLLTGRNEANGQAALARLRHAAPGTVARFALLDVASLAGIQAFAETVTTPVAVLVNNAGVMALPTRETTVDGFERQIGTNYLGHFALTARLLPHLSGGRVVNISSLAHRRAVLGLDDLQSERSYAPWPAYCQSKLAMLIFALELQRRSLQAGWGLRSYAAHPGWAATSLVQKGPGGGSNGLKARLMQAGFNALGQSAAAGAEPTLYAALNAAAKPGGYYGPCCWGETRGRPTPSRIMPQAENAADNARLWALSEQLTGVTFPL